MTPKECASLPAWGAWIEISFARIFLMYSSSLPAWGAWIEMGNLLRKPSGMSVAPRMGSVD